MSVPGSARNKTAENYRDFVFAAREIEASYGSEREGIATIAASHSCWRVAHTHWLPLMGCNTAYGMDEALG